MKKVGTKIGPYLIPTAKQARKFCKTMVKALKSKRPVEKYFFVLILLLVACGAPPPDPPDPVSVYSLVYGPRVVAPGEEGVSCLDVKGPLADTWVGGWHFRQTLVHHATIWSRTSGAPYRTETTCTGVPATTAAPVFFFEPSSQDEAFAPGEAFLLPGSANLIWDVHRFNGTSHKGEAGIDVDFLTVEGPPPVRLHGITLNGGRSISVAPGAHVTLHYEATSPPEPIEVRHFTAHVHAHNVAVALSVEGSEVYRSTDWLSPALVRFSPSLLIPGGSHVSWSCEINNTTALTLRYTNEVQTGEMCIVYGLASGAEWSYFVGAP